MTCDAGLVWARAVWLICLAKLVQLLAAVPGAVLVRGDQSLLIPGRGAAAAVSATATARPPPEQQLLSAGKAAP